MPSGGRMLRCVRLAPGRDGGRKPRMETSDTIPSRGCGRCGEPARGASWTRSSLWMALWITWPPLWKVGRLVHPPPQAAERLELSTGASAGSPQVLHRLLHRRAIQHLGPRPALGTGRGRTRTSRVEASVRRGSPSPVARAWRGRRRARPVPRSSAPRTSPWNDRDRRRTGRSPGSCGGSSRESGTSRPGEP